MRISSVSLTTEALTRWSSDVAVRPPPRLAAAAARKPRSLTWAVYVSAWLRLAAPVSRIVASFADDSTLRSAVPS